jgi:hypothetical protein
MISLATVLGMPPEWDVARLPRWADTRNADLPDRARGQIRYEFDLEGDDATLMECRPPWRPANGPDRTRLPIVRFHYSRTSREWSTYRRDRNLDFHRHDPFPQTPDLDFLLAALDGDHGRTFWG